MYQGEDNGPASGEWYLDRSILKFSEGLPCSDGTVYSGPWTPEAVAKLGRQVPLADRWMYLTKELPLCQHEGNTWYATDHTRAYDSGRPAQLDPKEGFFLEFDQSHTGTVGMPFSEDAHGHRFKTPAPIYYNDGELLDGNGSSGSPPQAYIAYWFFYPYNDAPGIHLAWDHQGDWENMSLLFRQLPNDSTWTLTKVAYSAHGAPKERRAVCPPKTYAGHPLSCPAPRVLWEGTRRLVGYVGNGDHATYSSPGDHDIAGPADDHTSSLAVGFSWLTWQALLPLEPEGWAGFCGAWGTVGSQFPQPFFAGDRTGPLGPGCRDDEGRQLKLGRPRAWGSSRAQLVEPSAVPGQAVGVDRATS